jgi:hypothetical protein
VVSLTETNISKTKKNKLQLKLINSWYLDSANYLVFRTKHDVSETLSVSIVA